MTKGKDIINTAVYSAAHFATDFACAFLIYAFLYDTGELAIKLLLYNFCAFALQMPLGLIADKLNRNSLVTALGCAAVVIALALAKYPYAAVITAGLGNALFHVGGGLAIMNTSGNKFAKLGIFVAPGAFGLFLGTLLGKVGTDYYYPILLLMLLFVGAVILTSQIIQGSTKSSNPLPSLDSLKSVKSAAALVCLFLVVVLRSYAGMLFDFSWKSGTAAVIFVLGVVFGKALGGIFSDGVTGVIRTRFFATQRTCLLRFAQSQSLASKRIGLRKNLRPTTEDFSFVFKKDDDAILPYGEEDDTENEQKDLPEAGSDYSCHPKLGLTLTSSVSLVAAGILFLFSDNAVCGIIAVFLFNMTMPLTLGLAARIFDRAKGFAFGILTFALFVGCLPEFLGLPEPLTGSMAYCVICVLSLILLLAGIRLSGGKEHD